MIRIKLKKFLSAPPDPLEEGRVDDIKKKYPGKDDLVDKFSKAPGNNKYLDWMMLHHTETSPEEMLDTVQKFDKFLSSAEKKDINSYQDFESFYDVVSDLRPPTRQLEREGTQKIYEDGDILIVRPLNQEASCKLGQNTKWCIAATKTKNYFKNYAERGIRHYIVINKKLPKENPNYKIAFSMAPGYEDDFEIHNAEDTALSPEGVSKIYGEELYIKILNIVKGNLPSSQPSSVVRDSFIELKNYLKGESEEEEEVTEMVTSVKISRCFFDDHFNLISDEPTIKRTIRKILNLNNEFVNKVISDILTASHGYTERQWEGLIKKYINDDSAKKILNYKIDSIVSDIKTTLKHDYERSDYDKYYALKRNILNQFYVFRNTENQVDLLNKFLALNNDDINIILQDIYSSNYGREHLPPLSPEVIRKISKSYSLTISDDQHKKMLKAISEEPLNDIRDSRITRALDNAVTAYFYGENVEKADEIIDALAKVPRNLYSFVINEFAAKKDLIKYSNREFLIHVLDKIESYGEHPYASIFISGYDQPAVLLSFIEKLIIPLYERSRSAKKYQNYMDLLGEQINEAGEQKSVFLKAIKDAAGDKYSEILNAAGINNLSESKLFTFNKDKKVFKLLR